MNKTVFLVILLMGGSIIAQNKGSISGKILDSELNYAPILFANVQLKGQSQKVLTNFHGVFEINDIQAGKYTVVISYAGYDNLEIPVQVKKNRNSKVECRLSQKRIVLNNQVFNKPDNGEFYLLTAAE